MTDGADLAYTIHMSDAKLLVLTSPGCHHCDRFRDFWEEESAKWPNVSMREVSVLTEEGQSLAREHAIFASPGIIIDGELVSTGGFDPKDLRRRFEGGEGEHS